MDVSALQGDTLDALCHRHLGTTDIAEAVFALNPGVAAHGPVLPMGTVVRLPDQVSAPVSKQIIQLWD